MKANTNYVKTLEDIIVKHTKRIAELEKELKKKESVILHMLERDEAHNLEQQAKGVEDSIRETANSKFRMGIRGTGDLYNYATELLKQSEALKEQANKLEQGE